MSDPIIIPVAPQALSVRIINDEQAMSAGINPAIFQGPIGPVGPTPVLTIGTVDYGDDPSATITGTPESPILNLVLPRGLQGPIGLTGPTGDTGPIGNGITSFVRTSGNGAPGTTDVYTLTMTDGQTAQVTVYNGNDGTGTGDMHTSEYVTPGGTGVVLRAAQADALAEGATVEIEQVNGLGEALNGKVPTTRKVNNKALDADVTLDAGDVGARPDDWKPSVGDVEGLGGALAAKANVTTEIPVTIPLGAWQGSAAPFTAEVAVPGVAVDTKGRIGLANGLTPEQREAGRGAMIDVASVGAGVVNLVADGDKPGIDLPAVVMVWG